jgi:hypothetical protein
MTRWRLASLIPLQILLLFMGIHNIDQPGRVREIAGWGVLAGVLATLIGYALAWRRIAQQQGD